MRYPQPFKIRRLGHFGFNVADLQGGIDFYSKLLGFRITDTRDLKKIPGREEMAKRLEDGRIVFMSHNSDHHAFLLAHKSLGAIFGDDAVSKDITVNQITWQVGTMEEVFAAADYFQEKQVEIRRVGRDMPGSNWHTYIRDPDGHTVELYYGMEQIGWDGRSKPETMYYRAFRERPELPQISEEQEVRDAVAKGIDINAGNTIHDRSERGVRRRRREAAAAVQDHQHRADEPVRGGRRRVRGVLHADHGLRADRGGDLQGPSLRLSCATAASTTACRCSPRRCAANWDSIPIRRSPRWACRSAATASCATRLRS